MSTKADALIAYLQIEIAYRSRKKITLKDLLNLLAREGLNPSLKTLCSLLEKPVTIYETHGLKPANGSAKESALILVHRIHKEFIINRFI